MTTNRNRYPFHNSTQRHTLTPADAQRQADAVAAFHARKRAARTVKRLQLFAAACATVALAFALFYSL